MTLVWEVSHVTHCTSIEHRRVERKISGHGTGSLHQTSGERTRVQEKKSFRYQDHRDVTAIEIHKNLQASPVPTFPACKRSHVTLLHVHALEASHENA